MTGLLDQSFDTVGVDVTYAANDKVNLMAGYVYETYFFDMAAAYIPRGLQPPFEPANLWGNQTDDKVDTFRAALDWTLTDKLTLGATFDYTKPRSESVYDFAEAGTPIGGLNEANGVFPANVPPVPGFPVTTFDRFPTVDQDVHHGEDPPGLRDHEEHHGERHVLEAEVRQHGLADREPGRQRRAVHPVHGPDRSRGRTAGSSSARRCRATTPTSSGPP